jgi:hypothetical protein
MPARSAMSSNLRRYKQGEGCGRNQYEQGRTHSSSLLALHLTIGHAQASEAKEITAAISGSDFIVTSRLVVELQRYLQLPWLVLLARDDSEFVTCGIGGIVG